MCLLNFLESQAPVLQNNRTNHSTLTVRSQNTNVFFMSMNDCQVSSHDERQERAAAVLAAAGKKLDVGSLGTTTPSSHLGTDELPRSKSAGTFWKLSFVYFSQGGIWISSLEGNHPSKKFAVVWQLINCFFKIFYQLFPCFSKFIS